MTDLHKDFKPGRLNLNIPIFQKTYELYKLFYQFAPHFPKKDRYTIGQRIENSMLGGWIKASS